MSEILKFIGFDNCARELRVSPGELKSLVNTGQLSTAQIHKGGMVTKFIDVKSLLHYQRENPST